jgi:membrane-associated protease RseP (regulator of RpoE activity)
VNGTPQSQPDRPGINPGAFFDLHRPLRRTPAWVHLLLFVATFVSVTVIGGLNYGGYAGYVEGMSALDVLADRGFYLSGMAFSVPLIFILSCHELGHYLAARRNGLDASLPYFIPLPIPLFLFIGSLGALIRIREPFKTRRQLLQVGAWGPIAGFLASLPFLAWGIQRSQIAESLPDNGFIDFGEPIIYVLIEWIVRPGLPAGSVLMLDPIGMAAWFGLLFTMLNMLPFSQLDGGHVVYGLLGRLQHRIAWPLVIVFALLGFWWPGWFVWAIIAAILRPKHPPVWFEGLEPPPTATIPGWVAVAIFVLCFMPRPITLFL